MCVCVWLCVGAACGEEYLKVMAVLKGRPSVARRAYDAPEDALRVAPEDAESRQRACSPLYWSGFHVGQLQVGFRCYLPVCVSFHGGIFG